MVAYAFEDVDEKISKREIYGVYRLICMIIILKGIRGKRVK